MFLFRRHLGSERKAGDVLGTFEEDHAMRGLGILAGHARWLHGKALGPWQWEILSFKPQSTASIISQHSTHTHGDNNVQVSPGAIWTRRTVRGWSGHVDLLRMGSKRSHPTAKHMNKSSQDFPWTLDLLLMLLVFPLPHERRAFDRGTEKAHKFFQYELFGPTQNPPFWVPRKKKVYVPHFLGKDAKKGPT